MPEKVSDENGSPSDKILNTEVIKEVLLKDKGEDATLETWSIKNFTSKGDNYVCLVCSVKVAYSIGGKTFDTSYIVKLNPCLKSESMAMMFFDVFNKEGKFYFDLVPRLDNILDSINLQHLQVPKALTLNMEKNKEYMFMEDLRILGFKMHNRTIGLDVKHTNLALKELAKLHAVSMILHLEEPQKSFIKKFPYMDNLLETSSGMRHLYDQFIGFTHGLIDIAKDLQGYVGAANWMKTILPGLYERWIKDINKAPKFITVCHGDSWCNNMLFRYDDRAVPVEVRLLDMQLYNIGSLMQDITLFIFSSVRGTERRNHIGCYLDNYYASFSSVFAAADKPMPFTRGELHKEYERMFTYGITMGLMSIPIAMESDDIPNLDENLEEATTEDDSIAPLRRQVLYSFHNNTKFRLRVLDLFNDIMMDNRSILYK